jgi:hypothetical protein
VVEGGVDHAIGSGSTTAQAFQIIERAAMYGGACRAQRRCSGVRAREAEHLMSGIEQFFDDGGADRRAKLDPASFGFPLQRRRTPGLRREEVAQRAHVSAIWYTWLEHGRGGAPSAEVLDRLARALMLTEVEREHLFLLGLGRPPEVRYQETEGVTPRLQNVAREN